jgi:uncharacterized membrane protein YhiD involved in acid resistance
MQEINIEYIGRHARMKDGLYGTGEWEQGQVKSVPVAIATKILKHADAYVESTVKSPVKSVAVAIVETEQEAELNNTVQETIDAIQTMDVDGVKKFAEQTYNMKLDGRKGLAKLRAEAQNLIHQFGIPE